MKIVVLLVLCASSSCTSNDDSRRSEPAESPPAENLVASLPEDLWSLQEQSGYLEWKPVRMFSRSLDHFRQMRFRKGSNVAVSETGSQAGQVDVVEVILLPSSPDRETEFALYDPMTGQRLQQYPESVAFDIQDISRGSRTPVPGVCTACHHSKRPLNAALPWSSELEEAILDGRRRGFGIRQEPVDPVPENKATRDAIWKLNALMREEYPEHFNDMRTWLKELLDSAH